MSYQSEYPAGITVNPAIVQFFENFYKVSDTPGADDEYVDLFTADATFIPAVNKGVGTEEIRVLRKGMWARVGSRKHQIHQIFPFGNDADQFMLHGSVDFEMKTGEKRTVEWAAKSQVAQGSDGKWRHKFYQVYLDTAATAPKQ